MGPQINTYIYCDCGRSPCSNYAFKCKELDHGKLFERFEKGILLQLLGSLDPMDELNILIIGPDVLFSASHNLSSAAITSLHSPAKY